MQQRTEGKQGKEHEENIVEGMPAALLESELFRYERSALNAALANQGA